MSYFPDLQFLDLDDVSKEEADDIHRILYISRTPRSVALPWEEDHVDWNQPSSYEGETSECESGTECYPTTGPQPVPVPVPTSLHQVYQPHGPQGVPTVQLSYLQPTTYYQQPQPPHQVYEGGRRRSKASPKRSSSGASASPSTPTGAGTVPPTGAGSVAPPGPYQQLAQYSYHPPLVPGPAPGQFQYMAGAMPAAQHATGHPLFLTPQIPVYPAGPHIYPQYSSHQQVFSPGLHTHPGSGQERSGKGDESGSVSSGPASGGSVLPPAGPHIHHQHPSTTLPSSHHQPASDIDVGMVQQQVGLHTLVMQSSVPHGPPQQVIAISQEPQVEDRRQPSPLTHNASVNSTLANTDTDTKPVEIQEGVGATRVVIASKSLPPQSAIKTTSLPPSGAIKSNPVKPSSLPINQSGPGLPAPPAQVIPPRDVEESEPPSPAVMPTPPAVGAIPNTPVVVVPLATPITPTVGSIPLGQQPQIGAAAAGAQPLASLPPQSATIPPQPAVPIIPGPALPCPALPVPPVAPIPVNQPKQKGSWAGLFKSSGASSSVSPQSMPQSPFMVQSPVVQPGPALPQPSHPNSVPTQDYPQSGKMSGKTGLSKGPPPQNSVVIQPPPLLSSGNFHSSNVSQHHNTASTPPPQHQHHVHGDAKHNTAQQSSRMVHPPGHSVANSQDPILNRVADLLSEYELEHRAVVLTPRGLNNPSNYCYINATLQALLACAPFYNLVSTLAKHKPLSYSMSSNSSKSATPVIDSMIQFVSEFNIAPPNRLRKERSEKAQARKDGGGVDQDPGILPGPSFEPSYVYRMVHNSFSLLQLEDRQEDAEEFLTVLLNGLNDEMMELLKLKGIGLSNGEVTTNGDSHAEMDNSDWKEVMNKGMSRVTRRTEVGRTPLTDIFMGQIRSRVERSDPQLSTDNIQPFFSLHLDVESCNTVEEALAKMTSEKAVEGGQSGEETTTASYIDQYPLVLILHLKCFHFSNGRLTKIAKSLDFPIDLRIGSKLMQTNKSKQYAKGTAYKLFAVVYHEGKEATKGHYLADVYHVGSSCWIRYDDAQVKSVSEHQVLKPKPPRVPYLLLYRRLDKHSRS